MPLHRVGLHVLTEDDEPAFQALLREVYGETYSYRALYEPGGVAGLIREGRAKLWGDFDEEGRLAGHTGILFKDPRGDYVESGMSFKRPRARGVTPDALAWPRILGDVAAGRHALVHQNTTTWHPLAQRYAERYMAARASGLILGYAVGERLVGWAPVDRPMDAVTMTSRVLAAPDRDERPRYVPPGPWGEWLRELFASFGLRADVAEGAPPAYAVETFERVEALDLVRRVVVAPTPSVRVETERVWVPRTELLHLPTDRRVLTFARFEAVDFVPVGVRLHATRPDEVVLQRLPREDRREALANLRAASLAGTAAPLVQTWMARCAPAT